MREPNPLILGAPDLVSDLGVPCHNGIQRDAESLDVGDTQERYDAGREHFRLYHKDKHTYLFSASGWPTARCPVAECPMSDEALHKRGWRAWQRPLPSTQSRL